MTWPVAMRRARSTGAPATMAIVTRQLSMFVPTKAAAAIPRSAGSPAAAAMTAVSGSARQPAGLGMAGPKGLSPRSVTRCA